MSSIFFVHPSSGHMQSGSQLVLIDYDHLVKYLNHLKTNRNDQFLSQLLSTGWRVVVALKPYSRFTRFKLEKEFRALKLRCVKLNESLEKFSNDALKCSRCGKVARPGLVVDSQPLPSHICELCKRDDDKVIPQLVI